MKRSAILVSIAVASLLSLQVRAQSAEATAASKDVVPAGVPAFTAFGQWVQTAVPPEPYNFVVEQVEPLPWTPPVAVGTAFQPMPVILGAPELPLQRPVLLPPGVNWAPQFNYQGMHVRFVVLNARGRQRELRPMSDPPRPGERFKIRVTPTFDAVSDIDMVVGADWQLRRVGQVWPQPGYSVEIRAGETADLPIQPAQYFVMPPASRQQALVLSVRHPQALATARSEQPAYRLDSSRGSDYLQLVTAGRLPAIEQLITPGR